MNGLSVLTVTQINRYIKSILENDQKIKDIYVTGEISNLTVNAISGHIYFSLRDRDSVIRCIIFSSMATRLSFKLSNGVDVLVKGYISVFERSAIYQINVVDIATQGVGSSETALRELKQRLLEQGVFDDCQKKKLPMIPKNIAIVTSNSGAVVSDIINIISHDYPLANVLICDVNVGGDNSPRQIAEAIGLLSDQMLCDVIIVGRGGGAAEDLWAFNTEIVAMAIYNCVIPIVSAVGHKTDFTLADLAADVSAQTPTAAAQLIVSGVSEAISTMRSKYNNIYKTVNNKFSKYQSALSLLKTKLHFLAPLNQLNLSQRILNEKYNDIKNSQHRLLDSYFNKLSMIQVSITQSIQKQIDIYESRLIYNMHRINNQSVPRVIKRGFAVVSIKDKLISSVLELAPGEHIDILLNDGNIKAKVISTTKTPSNLKE